MRSALVVSYVLCGVEASNGIQESWPRLWLAGEQAWHMRAKQLWWMEATNARPRALQFLDETARC